MSSDDIAIRVENLSKCYQIYEHSRDRLLQMLALGRKQYFREFWALRNVSFDVRKGETVGIIGRNGSGKSTLLQMVCGTLSPSSGAVRTNGRVSALLELGSGFNPEFSGRENIYMNGSVLGLTEADIATRYEEIVAFSEIGEFIDQPVKTYSSGMIVRLAFAVSVYVDPDILVVDEALAVGDAAFQYKCLDRLKQMAQSGVTLLFVSHDIGMVQNFCDRAIYLHNGEIKAQGASDNLAELYMMDIRSDQRKLVDSPRDRIVLKANIGCDDKVAFGTGQGKITSAVFRDTGAMKAIFTGGERAEVLVNLEYDFNLSSPCLSVIVQNTRMIDLAGCALPLPSGDRDGDIVRCSFVVVLPIRFDSGRYFVTLRLESRLSGSEFFPIDKQPGVLSFDVNKVTAGFPGTVVVDISGFQVNN